MENTNEVHNNVGTDGGGNPVGSNIKRVGNPEGFPSCPIRIAYTPYFSDWDLWYLLLGRANGNPNKYINSLVGNYLIDNHYLTSITTAKIMWTALNNIALSKQTTIAAVIENICAEKMNINFNHKQSVVKVVTEDKDKVVEIVTEHKPVETELATKEQSPIGVSDDATNSVVPKKPSGNLFPWDANRIEREAKALEERNRLRTEENFQAGE